MADDAFIQGLIDDPEDDELRLVYADWLDERGDIRGEFLREAVKLKAANCKDQQFEKRRRHFQELRQLVPSYWIVIALPNIAEDDVRAAVIATEILQSNLIYANVENGSDPSWYLLDRLYEVNSAVKPISAMPNRETIYQGIFDDSGDSGMLIQIDALDWRSDTYCEVEGGCFYDGLAAIGNLYRVVLRSKGWAVASIQKTWQS